MRRTVKVQALASNDTIYQMYSRLGLSAQRNGASGKEILKQSSLLLLWFVALTTLFVTQNNFLHAAPTHKDGVAPITASAQALRMAEKGNQVRL